MTIPIPVCAACGTSAFPPRVLCPKCGASQWRNGAADRGIVMQVTTHRGTPIAAIRIPENAQIIARRKGTLEPGQIAKLDVVGGAPTASFDP